MTLLIPTQPVANQILTVPLANQNVQLVIQQKFYGLFIDVYINNTLIVGGQICENLNRIIRGDYLGFIGNLVFLDTQGTSDPYYTGLNSRYLLLYIEVGDDV